MPHDPIVWLSTREAADALGITPRTLYRFIDEGQLAAYQFGRVIRLKESDVDAFIERSRIPPGRLRHLYPGDGNVADDLGQVAALHGDPDGRVTTDR